MITAGNIIHSRLSNKAKFKRKIDFYEAKEKLNKWSTIDLIQMFVVDDLVKQLEKYRKE